MIIDKDQQTFFDSLIKDLNEKRALDNMIIVGGWALNLYSYHYNNPMIPTKNTVDIDFLFREKPKIKEPFNLDKFLEDRGFKIEVSLLTGERKFVNKNMDIDFLIPLIGRPGDSSTTLIKEYNIKATKLRYLNISTKFTIKVNYKSIDLTLPHPAAYTYGKYMVFPLRQNKEKAKKDLDTAQRMSDYIMSDKDHFDTLIKIMEDLPKKWNDQFMNRVKEYYIDFYQVLNSVRMESVVDLYMKKSGIPKDYKDKLLDVEKIINSKNITKYREQIYIKSVEGLKEKDILFYVNSVLNKGKKLSVKEFEKQKNSRRKNFFEDEDSR